MIKETKQKLKKIWSDHFYPHNKLKECITASPLERRNNYYYNQENKNFMFPPILTWTLISVYSLLLISVIEKILDKTYFKDIDLSSCLFPLRCSIISLGLLFTISFVVTSVFIASYLYLSFVNEE